MSDNFSQYLLDVAYTFHNAFDWRFGQTCFNVFYGHEPQVCDNEIRGTFLDPFYDDDRVPEFLQFVRDYWAD